MARSSFLIVFLQFVLHRVEMATIPTEIGLQTDLETLSWDSKGYTGTIPTQFGLLTKMSSGFSLGREPDSGSRSGRRCSGSGLGDDAWDVEAGVFLYSTDQGPQVAEKEIHIIGQRLAMMRAEPGM